MRISDWSSDVCSSDLSRVGLRYRSRSQWLFIELGEFPSPVSSPACGKDGLDFFEWHRRNLIVERREGSNPGPGKQIAARRQQLSKLYSDRTNVATEFHDRRRPQFPKSEERRGGKECVWTC